MRRPKGYGELGNHGNRHSLVDYKGRIKTDDDFEAFLRRQRLRMAQHMRRGVRSFKKRIAEHWRDEEFAFTTEQWPEATRAVLRESRRRWGQ